MSVIETIKELKYLKTSEPWRVKIVCLLKLKKQNEEIKRFGRENLLNGGGMNLL